MAYIAWWQLVQRNACDILSGVIVQFEITSVIDFCNVLKDQVSADIY